MPLLQVVWITGIVFYDCGLPNTELYQITESINAVASLVTSTSRYHITPILC